MPKRECENMQKDPLGIRCKATGYLCRYIPADRKNKFGPCLFDPMYLKCKQMKEMVASIRAVKPGSVIFVPYRTRYGWYTREMINTSRGKVLSINNFGRMEVEVDAWKGTWEYGPEDFTRKIFLNNHELQAKLESLREESEDQQRIEKERGEEHGAIDF